jgi:hypothetical protein
MSKAKTKFDEEVEKLGISKDEAVQILRANGVTGSYEEAKLGEYLSILKAHVARRTLMLDRVKMTLPTALPDACPLCGAPIEPHPLWDGMYGCPRGWKCTADVTHFHEAFWKTVYTWMTKGKDPEDSTTYAGTHMEKYEEDYSV